MKKILALILILTFPGFAFCDESLIDSPQSQENHWVAPPPPDANGALVHFNLQAVYERDSAGEGTPFSFFDLSAKRPLDENSVSAEGKLRILKDFSTSDGPVSLELRLAKVSYLEPWLQLTAGRFDMFPVVSPNSFFGAYPLMGIHRVDGVLAVLPFSFLFKVGPPTGGSTDSSPPLALSVFYAPSLFSAEQAQYDGNQSFLLSQIRARLSEKDFDFTLRGNLGLSQTNFFSYSSLNGGLSYSIAGDMTVQNNYSLTAEYGSQSLSRSSETSALAVGFKAVRLGTWGAFSVDEIGLEAQFPFNPSLANPFTGGNGIHPEMASLGQNCWYIHIKTRLKGLFIELHLTNNQDDYTLNRLTSAASNTPFTGSYGPGRETDGAGLPLRASSYNAVAGIAQVGVEF